MKKYSLLFLLLFIIVALLFPASVMAHARWVLDSVTPPRTNDTGLKISPCGGASRTNRPTIFSAGQEIELEFEETINHPGHYRIAFSPADDLNFDSNILAENIPDVTNTGRYTQVVNIPMEVCSACTLQLIQVMTTSTSPQPGDYYYSCADIQVTDPGDTTPPLPVNSLSAQPGNAQANLDWTNPINDFYQVVVLKDTSPVVGSPVNGNLYSVGESINSSEIVYVGDGSGFTATSLMNDMPYYFKVFSQNPRKNYATGIEINVTPTATGGDTGNTPGNINDPDSSGGGSLNLLFLFVVVVVRWLGFRWINMPK